MIPIPRCTCVSIDAPVARNTCHREGCPRFWLDMACAQCAAMLERRAKDPRCVIEDDVAHVWCSAECADTWRNDPAFPDRAVGWVNVSDLTPEQLNESLNDIGLALEGVGKRNPS